MIIARISRLCLAAAALFAAVAPAGAVETGMAGIHSWQKVGKKTCLVGHYHDGAGSGPSRKTAEMATIQSWASFTDLEYGSSWADYRIAVSKTMTCGQEGAARWSCQVSAIACRPY